MIRCSTIVVLLALTGCRAQPYVNAHIETLNAEHRQLEDYVYALEEENQRLAQELDYLRQRGTVKGGASPRSAPDRARPFRIRPEHDPASAAPETLPPGAGSAPATEAPTIELPGTSPGLPSRPPGARSLLQPSNSDAPAESAPSISLTSHTSTPQATPATAPTDSKVTHIHLNPILTRGADFDQQPGDDGLAVVLEPRNAADEYVPQAGAVSIVLLDPSRQGESARIARWNLTSEEIQQRAASAQHDRDIKLDLPWPAAPPTNGQLKLFVRFETADGRRLEADREVHVTLPGQFANRWTPRPVDRAKPPLPPAPEVAAVATKHDPPSAPPAALSGSSASLPRPVPAWSPHR